MTAERPVLAVSACLFVDGSALLVERGRWPFRGLFSLPGGRVEFGERLIDAARREILEETGMTADPISFHTLHEAIGDGSHVVIAVYRGVLATGSRPVAGSDAAAIRFATPGEIEALEGEGKTTPGLAGIVRSAARAHGLSA